VHYALVPDENRTVLLVVDGALPAVDSKRLRTPLVADTLEREIGLRAPFLRASAVVRDEDGCADRGSRSTRRPGWSRPSYGTPPSSG
jgi:hypothetical protein